MIHIIDTEHPWDVYSISSGHSEVISCLEWDHSGDVSVLYSAKLQWERPGSRLEDYQVWLNPRFCPETELLIISVETTAAVCLCLSGSRLLSADGNGQIKCWAMSDHLVNSWESVLSSSLEGDPIVALSWLHNGVKLALHVEMVTTATRLFRWTPCELMSEAFFSLLLVRFYQLWWEILSCEVLSIHDSVRWEANGGLVGGDSQWSGHRITNETRWRSADSQRESVSTERTGGAGRHCLHRRRKYCSGSDWRQQHITGPVLQGESSPGDEGGHPHFFKIKLKLQTTFWSNPLHHGLTHGLFSTRIPYVWLPVLRRENPPYCSGCHWSHEPPRFPSHLIHLERPSLLQDPQSFNRQPFVWWWFLGTWS